MKALEAGELLHIWERGAALPPAQAILTLLLAACPEISLEQLQNLTIGERDALLLTQREWMFGPQLEASAACPQCGEQLEFGLAIRDLRVTPALIDASLLGQNAPLSAAIGEYQIEFRLPTLADLSHVDTQEKLLARCLIRASKAGQAQAFQELPPHTIESLNHRMATADPQADAQLALTCPACEYAWLETFDIAAFLWEEVKTWAQRTLLEIHQLARAYGWSETEILAVSPARRQIYLTLIEARA